jgi:microcystin-dependent protein
MSIRNKNQFSFSDLTSNLKLVDIIELGYQPNKTNSGAHSIAIGSQTGITNQGTFGIAIGYQAGQLNQGSNTIAIGEQAGQNQQKPFAIAVGNNAGQNNQGTAAIALGSNAGYNHQQSNSITIGTLSAYNNQGTASVAIGTAAGQNNQGAYSIALGNSAGQNNQGINTIVIGPGAGQTNQLPNSIILDASESVLNSNRSGIYVRPIREADNIEFLEYNETTYEITRREFKIQIAGDFTYALFNSDFGKWLLCDGRSLSVNDYPKLFAVMGYSFGGSGANFNLPDPKGRVLGVIGQGPGLSNRTLGESIGAETHTLTIDEMPNHNHTINDPGHTHTYNNSNDNFLMTSGLNFLSKYPKGAFNTLNTFTANTGITIDNTGGGQPHDVMNPTLFIGNLFVYTD